MSEVRVRSIITNAFDRSDGSLQPHIDLESVMPKVGMLMTDLPILKAADDALVHRAGDVLFGKLRPYLGKSYLCTASGTASSEFLVLRPGRRIDGDFLYYLTQSDRWIDWACATASGSKMPRTSWPDMAEFRFDLPPIDRQQAIARHLSTTTRSIQALSVAARKTLAALTERRSANAVHEVLGDRHRDSRPSSVPWATHVPVHWIEVKLGLVARMGSGHTPSRSRPEWWDNCTIHWITTGDVSHIRDDRRETIYDTVEMISEVGLANSAAELHPVGTVVLSRTASAGYSAVMGTAMATSQDFATWTCGPRLDPFYLLWCLRAMRPDLLGRLAMGSTHKTIYMPDLQMLRIPLPPIEEQRAIVERIRERNAHIDQLIDAVRRQIELLAERRVALITAAVTGQIDVSTASGLS